MKSGLATDSNRGLKIMTVLLVCGLLTGACAGSGNEAERPERTVLSTRSGETLIQVTESDRSGNQVIRVRTVFRGKESIVILNIDQQNYEIEIPLSLEQQMPRPAGTSTSTQGNFQDLLIAQHLEKAQEATLNGDYNAALRQVNLVALIQPDHVKAHEMKGSIYYAMGNYQLAQEEWERVLTLDPSNEEVLKFQEFMKNRRGATQPSPPGSSPAPEQPPAPDAANSRNTQGGAQ